MTTPQQSLVRSYLGDLAAEMEAGIEEARLDELSARAALGYARRIIRRCEAGLMDSIALDGALMAARRLVETVRVTPRYPDAPWGGSR